MSVNTPNGSVSIGRDCQVVILHPLAPGGRVDIPNVTGFDCKQNTVAIDVDKLDGRQIFADLPKGWTGTFMAERGGSGLDDFFALLEAAWYSPAGTMLSATVYQYVTEPNGSSSTYQFTGASLKFGDPGSWKGDATVKQTVDFRASDRKRI